MPEGVKVYLGVTCAFSMVHAIWDIASPEYKDFMVVDKIGLVLLATVSGFVIWPILLREDLILLECLVRGCSTKHVEL